MNMYSSLITYTRDASINSHILDKVSYTDFLEFVYHFSNKFPNACPS